MSRHYAHFAALPLALALAACPAAEGGTDTDASASSTGAPDDSTGGSTDAPDGTTDGSTGDSTGDDPTGGTTGAPACVEDDLMPQPFAGPGWDQDMGVLKEPLQEEYLASTTVLVLKPGKDQQFIGAVGPMVPVLEANPGVIGYSLASSAKCGTARTLTIWRDEAAMMQFVMSDEHIAGMSIATEVSSTGTVTSWTIPRAEVPVAWDAAIAKAAAATPSY